MIVGTAMVKVAINGFGRIGRVAFRVALERHKEDLQIVAINTSGSMPASGWAHMARFDSIYGRFGKEIKVEEKGKVDGEIGALVIDGVRYPLLAQRDPAKIPWRTYGVDVVIESTGVFTDENKARGHLTGGAKKVVISAPVTGGNIGTFIIGINQDKYAGEEIISNASCTTNCVAPVAQVMFANFGVKKAFMSTIHAYTASQELVDGSSDNLRRGRAAGLNIVPAGSGATTATAKAIPELAGIFDGLAFRVPVASGSVADFTFLTEKPTTVEEVNDAFTKASSESRWQGILAVTQDPIVSQDIIGRSESSIVDLGLTQVVGGDLVKVVSWYDNEWGYASRLVEQAILMGKSLDNNKT